MEFNSQVASLGSVSAGSISGDGSAINVAKPMSDGGGVAETSFGSMLADLANQTASSLQNAEVTSIRGIKGEVSAQEVVKSVMEAEQSLRMALAVRDKIISAYLEINRMQI